MSEPNTNTTSSKDNVIDEANRFIGRCKWFNNRAGYGFVTICGGAGGGERLGEDVFAHHSGCVVEEEQYRYLVQGEYVDFVLKTTDSDAHPFQASAIRGVGGGKLMCETRREQQQQRAEQEPRQGGGDRVERGREAPKRKSRPSRERIRVRGTGPREGEVWTMVREGSPERRRRQRPRRDDE